MTTPYPAGCPMRYWVMADAPGRDGWFESLAGARRYAAAMAAKYGCNVEVVDVADGRSAKGHDCECECECGGKNHGVDR